VGVAGIGLAVVAGGEQPDPGGELGRDIDDVLTVLEESLGQRPAGAVAASTAQTRSGQEAAYVRIAAWPARSVVNRPEPSICSRSSMTSMVADSLCRPR